MCRPSDDAYVVFLLFCLCVRTRAQTDVINGEIRGRASVAENQSTLDSNFESLCLFSPCSGKSVALDSILRLLPTLVLGEPTAPHSSAVCVYAQPSPWACASQMGISRVERCGVFITSLASVAFRCEDLSFLRSIFPLLSSRVVFSV